MAVLCRCSCSCSGNFLVFLLKFGNKKPAETAVFCGVEWRRQQECNSQREPFHLATISLRFACKICSDSKLACSRVRQPFSYCIIHKKSAPWGRLFYEWCRQQESNSRPDDYKSTALPTELCRHIIET